VTSPPVSQEIAGALAAYCFGGTGPSHSKLTSAFLAGGYGDVAPAPPHGAQGPNKEARVQRTVLAAIKRPNGARQLVDALLVQLRLNGQFDKEWQGYDASKFRTLERAFARSGWSLSADGFISPVSGLDLTTGGRDALDEQIARIRGATDDPGQLLGSAKDLLEAVSKFVLEEFSVPVSKNADFGHLWHLARDRLGILPAQIDKSLPGADSIRAILQSSWTIAEQANTLRGKQGTGHGRTLPTGVSPELALLVVREACSVAEYVLTTLDRLVGRA
jgi:hypothetical protein